MTLLIKVDRPSLTPTRAHPTDGGLDLRSKIEVVLPKGVRTLVDTGVRAKIPEGYVGLLIPRSSLSKKGIIATNSCGVIDADYRGVIMASLMYTGNTDWVVIDQDERIVQLVIVPVLLANPVLSTETDVEWNNTARGIGGFGSTGRN